MRGDALRPHPKYGVGKRMPGAVYLHRTAEGVLPRDIIFSARGCLPQGWRYDVVKLEEATSRVSFFEVPDFDIQDEPTQGRGWIVRRDKTTRLYAPPTDPFLYHHKWLMVHSDYSGFDVAKAKARSRRIQRLLLELAHVDPHVRSRIGRASYWRSEVLPRLDERVP